MWLVCSCVIEYVSEPEIVSQESKTVELTIVSTEYIPPNTKTEPFSRNYSAKHIVKFDYNGILTIVKDSKTTYDYCKTLGLNQKIKGEILITTYNNGEKDVQLKSIIEE